jgi:hypothetical protein
MGSTHFQMKALKNVSTEMALHVLAYNMKRVMRQTEKHSARADVFRSSLKNGHWFSTPQLQRHADRMLWNLSTVGEIARVFFKEDIFCRKHLRQ